MSLSVSEAIAYLNEPRWRHVSLGLSRMRELLKVLGQPQNSFLSVHIAGTNGKGSVSTYLSSILNESSLCCGLFTSPFVMKFEERIQLNGHCIPPDSLCEIVQIVKEAAIKVEETLGEHPTEFELMFAVACVFFSRSKCDIAVIECGLGGRLDATNVIQPVLCVLTPIGRDHLEILGNTIREIASEKAGIIKQNVPVISAYQPNDAAHVIKNACKQNNSSLCFIEPSDVLEHGLDVSKFTQEFTYKADTYETRMLGSYQPSNASLAIQCAFTLKDICGFSIEVNNIKSGILKSYLPGRFEVIGNAPLRVIDGSHNVLGVHSLCESLRRLGAKPATVTFVMSVMADKDYIEMLKEIKPLALVVLTFPSENTRSLSSHKLSEAAKSLSINSEPFNSAADAVRTALNMTRPEGIICAFGSLYSVAALKAAFA